MLERFRVPIFAVIAVAILAGIVALLTYRPAPVVVQIIPAGTVFPTSTPLPTLTKLPSLTPLPTITPQPTLTPGPIQVYVTGSVVKPRMVYSLPWGSRVQDVINAAGGPSADANLDGINLATILHDGDQIYVPSLILTPTNSSTGTPNTTHTIISATPPPYTATVVKKITATPQFPIRINSATSEQLQLLPGVGPKLAQEILDYRNQNGPFKSMADLDKVKGIGPATLAKWEGLIVFD